MRTAALLLILVLGGPGGVHAQRSADPFRFIVWAVEDVRALPGSLDGRWLLAGAGAGAGILAVSRFDGALTERTLGLRENGTLRVVEEFGHAKVMRPALVVVFVGGLMAGDTRLQDAAFTALESVILANLATNTLKAVFGRARPRQQEGPSSFRPFSGNTSFPSGHSTTAFAALTPFAAYYGGLTAVVVYTLAAATAFSRVATEAHWLSDAVGGSLIGFMVGWRLSNRHRESVRIGMSPTGVSLAIAF